MTSGIIIFGEPRSGKTFTSYFLKNFINVKFIHFDDVINLISEVLRLKFENKLPKREFSKFFHQNTFDSIDDFNPFFNELEQLIRKNNDFLENVFNKSIKNTVPLNFTPSEKQSRLIGLGTIGKELEPIAKQIIELVFKYIIKKQSLFVIEGAYFSEKQSYRKEIEKICKNITYLQCLYNNKDTPVRYKFKNEEMFELITILERIKEIIPVKQRYQIFSENEKGGISPSFLKISKLGFPKKLDGKNVLDIGCNEGFYCFECEKRGAKVTGIESGELWFTLATEQKKKKSSSVEFLHMDWRKIAKLENKFDLVIFLAAFHYIDGYQLDMLRSIYKLLNEDGLFILEIGLLDKNEGRFLIEDVVRLLSHDICQFTNKYTIEKLLRYVGFKKIDYFGKGEKLGDEIPRYVLHIRK